MTKPEDLVCSAEQAIKLKELGIKQHALFYFVEGVLHIRLNDETGAAMYGGFDVPALHLDKEIVITDFAAALTITDLSLCIKRIIDHRPTFKTSVEINDKYMAEHTNYSLSYNAKYFADTLIYALENKIIKPSQINEVL